MSLKVADQIVAAQERGISHHASVVDGGVCAGAINRQNQRFGFGLEIVLDALERREKGKDHLIELVNVHVFCLGKKMATRPS